MEIIRLSTSHERAVPPPHPLHSTRPPLPLVGCMGGRRSADPGACANAKPIRFSPREFPQYGPENLPSKTGEVAAARAHR